MQPCNSDEEIDDSWIHTSHNQFKHEKTGLCIGKFYWQLISLNFLFINFSFSHLQIAKTWTRIMFMLHHVIQIQKHKSGNSRRAIEIQKLNIVFNVLCLLLMQFVDLSRRIPTNALLLISLESSFHSKSTVP